VINCERGYQARGETEDELVADAEQDIQDKHPELAGEMGREQILALAQEE
jgi:hypothetical protein